MSKPFGGMATALKIRLKSITGKILIAFLVLVVCSTAISALSFRSILYRDLEKRVKVSLLRQAQEITFQINNQEINNGHLQQVRPHGPVPDFHPETPIRGQYIVIDPQEVILYSSMPDQLPVGKYLNDIPYSRYLYLSSSKANQGALLSVKVPYGDHSSSGGTVITFAEVKSIQALNEDILVILLKSIFIGFAIAVPLALILGRYLTKPILSLREYARAIAKRRFDVRLNIKSDDELADLAGSFNEMAVQLERSDISMRRFFQSASHELKTPLMSIQGYAEGIREGIFKDKEAERALEVVSRECQRLKSIVDEIIETTKIQCFDETYKLMPCNLKKIIEEVTESLRGYKIEKEIHLTTEADSDITVIGDPEKLHRLFNNLVANAIRHAKSQVEIRARQHESGEINIIVKDDGKGFNPQDLQHGFEYFYKGKNGGTGLGLSIARVIVEEQGGNIAIRNDADGGALVEINIPLNLS
jgi:signal transduction histidine kinase